MSHVSVWFHELAIMRFPHAWMVVRIRWVVLCQISIGTSVRSAGCWCMILCAIGWGNTWWEPFHRPVPRTLEEHHFITSKGLSLDLHVTCIRVVSWTCHHAFSTCLNGSSNSLSYIMSDYCWYFGAFSRLLVHDSVCKRSGQYMMRTISQTCSENSWGTSFHNI